MGREQLTLPFVEASETEDDPVSPEVYAGIVKAKSVDQVRQAFRGRRIPPVREEQESAPSRKRA